MQKENEDNDMTSLDGQEIMFGLDFSTLEVTGIEDDDCDGDDANQTNDIPPEIETTKFNPALVEDLLNYEDKSLPAVQSNFKTLFDWAIEKGARLDGIRYQEDQFGGRCLVASHPTTPGTALAVLPRSLRTGQAEACNKLQLPSDTPDLSALTLLVLFYCKENTPYAQCLPRQSEFTNALLMSDDDKKTWSQMPDYAAAIRRVQSAGEGCRDYIMNCLTQTNDNENKNNERTSAAARTLFWAISMVKSRSHAFGSKRGYWLTPVFDLANHSPDPNAALDGDDQGRLALRALKPIKEGEEISIDYQVEDDTMLLANYGFSLKFDRDQIMGRKN